MNKVVSLSPMDLGGEIAPIGGRPDSPESEEQSAVECNRLPISIHDGKCAKKLKTNVVGVFTDGAGCQAFQLLWVLSVRLDTMEVRVVA